MRQEARDKRQETRGKKREVIFLLLVSSFLSLFTVFTQISHGNEDRSNRLYKEARKDYYSLINSKELQEKRSNWLNCILKFESIYKNFPDSPIAHKSLFTAARLYSKLSNISSDKSDAEKSINLFNEIVKEYPQNSLADDAQYMIGEIYFQINNYPLAYSSYKAVIDKYPKGDMVKSAESKLSELSKVYQPDKQPPQSPLTKGDMEGEDKLAVVKGIRHWSNPEYTRIVIDMEEKVNYKEQRLANPDRLFIDIHNSRLSPEIKESISINDGLLKGIRAGQNQDDMVRVVLDLDSIGSYSVIHLQNPFRIVIDADASLTAKTGGGDIKTTKQAEGKTGLSEQESNKRTASASIDNIRRIVIDPGHGGKDSGAIGKRGLMEKIVVLDIAKKLKAIIKKKTNYEVILTRESDIFIPLEERTMIANIKRADLFISIHANASRKRNARGIETYFQGVPRTEEERETAARENMSDADNEYTHDDNILEFILADMKNTYKINESGQLAGIIQYSLIKGMARQYHGIKNLGVKQALFYVLHKAKMPSILIETSFISNPEEEKRFRDSIYRDYIASCIYNGIETYINRTLVAYRTE